MYVIKDGNGRTEPITYTVHEAHPGEARDIILEAYVMDAAVQHEYETQDDADDATITISPTDYFSKEEIEALKEIVENGSEAYWDNLDLDTIKESIDYLNKQDDIGDQIHEQRKDEQDER